MILLDAEFTTDTSTLCIFDVDAVPDLIDEDGDWWTLPEDELREVNAGRIFFAGLGSDGRFAVRVQLLEIIDCKNATRILNKSGRFFVGAGEEVVGDGLVPECVRGGGFVNVAPGVYGINATLSNCIITVNLVNLGKDVDCQNSLSQPIKIGL